MSVSTDVDAVAPPAPGSQRLGWLRAGLFALVVAVVAGGWWLSHPATVSGGGWAAKPAFFTSWEASEIGVTPSVGQTMLVDAGVFTRSLDGDPNHTARITLGDADLRVVENTAGAEVELVLCRHAGDGQDMIGAVDGVDIDAYCTAQVAPRGASAAFPVGAQLVVKITPRQPGEVRIEGLDLTYRDGIRLGTVRTGLRITSTTR